MNHRWKNLLRKPAVWVLLAVEVLVVGSALAAALRPAVVYEFATEQWENIAEKSEIGYDEDGRVGVTEMADGEDILQTPAMTLPKGHYKVTVDYRYVPSIWEGGVERHSYLQLAAKSDGVVTGGRVCIRSDRNHDTMVLNVRDTDDTIRLVAHNDSGIFTLGPIHIEQDMGYAAACVAGWIVLFVLLDVFLLLIIPGEASVLQDAELGASMFVLLCIAVLTCAMQFMNNGGTQGADWAFHLSRIEGIAQGLREGQFPVRIYSMAKGGNGYAPSLFYGELLLYFPAVLRLLGMTVQGAYHVFVFITQLATAGVAFFSFRQIFRHNKIALVGTALYMLSTYHMYKIYWLTAVGEYTAQIFLPLIPAALCLLYKSQMPTKRQMHLAFVELVAAFSGLVQTHILSLEMATLAVALFCLLNFRRTFTKKVFLTWLAAICCVVLLNLWFLIPFLSVMLSGNYNHMYVMSNNPGQSVKNGGLHIAELFGWEKSQNNFGPELWIGAAAMVWCWLAQHGEQKPTRRETSIGLWAVAMGGLACWMSTDTFPWNLVGRIPVIGRILVAIQFPGRYLTLATLLFVIATMCALSTLRRSRNGQACAVSVLLLAVSVMSTALFFRDYKQSVDDTYLEDNGQLIYASYRESNMAWFFDSLYLPDGAQQTRDGIVSGMNTTVEVKELTQENGVTTLTCTDTSGVEQHAELPLLYYPGYTIIEGQGSIFKTDNGLVGVLVPPNYAGTIKVAFREPKRWLMADLVSLLTAVGLAAAALYRRKNRKKNSI